MSWPFEIGNRVALITIKSKDDTYWAGTVVGMYLSWRGIEVDVRWDFEQSTLSRHLSRDLCRISPLEELANVTVRP